MDVHDLQDLIARAHAYRIEVDGQMVNLGEFIARQDADLTATELQVQRLQTLLARNLVLDRGSAEEAVDALGGLPEVFWLVEQYHLAASSAVAVAAPEGGAA